jgi:hypothetical protein
MAKPVIVGATIFLLVVGAVARTRPDLAGPVALVVAALVGGELYGNRN